MKKIDSLLQKTERLRKALIKTSFAAQHISQMLEEWNALLDNKKYSFGITPLLYALAIRYPELNALANEKLGLALMSDYLKNPVQKDSVLSVIGNCGLNKTEIKEILKESDVKYSTVPGKATHLLLGRSLSEDELAIVLENIILSDIRSLPAVTVVRSREMEEDATSKYDRSRIEIKIDPYPYLKQNKFSGNDTIKKISEDIKKIPGVIGFRETGDVTSSDV